MTEGYHYVTTPELLPRIAEEIAAAPFISHDKETTGLEPHGAKERLGAINTGKGVYVIDRFKVHPGPVLDALRGYRGLVVGQNIKFDARFALHHDGIEFGRVFDTFRASNLIYNGRESGHNLWDLYRRELGHEPTEGDLGGSDWSGELSKEQLDYSADDVIWLPRLYEVLRAKLILNGLVRVAQIEFNAILPEAAIENAGFYLDKDRWLAVAAKYEQREAVLRKELLSSLPSMQLPLPGFEADWNIASQPQLLRSLRHMGLNIASTSEDVLVMVDHPIVKKILDWREARVRATTFGADYLNNINPVTGRIHASLYPFTAAGRYATSRPNLAQIPNSEEYRRCFTGDLVACDFSQIELRILAQISGDEALREIYRQGGDVHRITAAVCASVSEDCVTAEQRKKAKAVGFGFCYGMREKKFVMYAKKSYGVSIPLAEATVFRNRYFQKYPGVGRWQRRELSDTNRKTGVCRTLSGRLRYLDETYWSEWLNTPVQGTGADMLKASLRNVYDRLRGTGARIVNVVHDELVVSSDGADVADAVRDGMTESGQQFLPDVPVVTEGGRVTSWADK